MRSSPFTLYAAIILQLIGALLTWYGALAMFTSAGLMPPNPVALVGVLVTALAGFAISRSVPQPAIGWWLSVALISLPFVLIAMPGGSGPECPPDHPPITNNYYCAVPRPLLVFVLAFAVLAVAMLGAARGLARLRRSERA